jgi:hypothetical protein
MAPATIERWVVRDGRQLSLDALAPPRARPPAPRPAEPVAREAAPAAAPAAVAAPAGGTLDDLISGAWRELGAQRVAACPVCSEPMRPRSDARGGQCGGCGTSLA